MELENIKSESELLKKQLLSERHTIKNLESLLATNRDKEFHSHLTSHEKDTEIQLLKREVRPLQKANCKCHNSISCEEIVVTIIFQCE